MSFQSISWAWKKDQCDGGIEPVRIDMVEGFNGTKYAIRQAGACMNRKGEWEFEPMPSSRTDEWLAEFRYDSWLAAAVTVERYVKHPYGRFKGYAK